MSGDGFDAVLAEMDKAFGMVACNGSVADPVCNEMKRRLSAAHAAEVGERDVKERESFQLYVDANEARIDAEARAEAAERDAREAMGLLRECLPHVVSRAQNRVASVHHEQAPAIFALADRATAFLAQHAQVGGGDGNGNG